MWDLKIMIQASLFMKQTDSQTETNLWLTKGKEGGGRINEEFCISRHKLLYIKEINNKVLPYSKGNYIQYLVINDNGKESEKKKRAYI